jgi:hypothetical protein
MSVKLFNLSKLPDEPMRSLLTAAKLAVGATGDVVVRVTKGGRQVNSSAQRANFVYQWALSARHRKKNGDYKMRRIQTSGGFIEMQPRIHRRYWNVRVPFEDSPTGFASKSMSAVDGLASAEDFFKTAVHEFSHIVQFQSGFRNFAVAHNGRRTKWRMRPEEIDAVNKTDAALQRLDRRADRRRQVDAWIIDFGIQIEERLK